MFEDKFKVCSSLHSAFNNCYINAKRNKNKNKTLKNKSVKDIKS